MGIKVREATFNDFALFELHPKNLQEIDVMSGLDYTFVLAALWELSTDKKIAFHDNIPVCITGIVDGYKIWLYFSKEVNELPLSFFKESKRFISDLLTKYDKIEGFIYYQNTFALEWAKLMKFTINDPVIMGVKQEMFYPFHMERSA